MVGAALAYGFGAFEQPEPPTGGPPTVPAQRPMDPSRITVSVLNGTGEAGLAARVADRVEAGGFKLGNVTNAAERERAESVILYVENARSEARHVGRRLRVAQMERAARDDGTAAGDASVVVVVGADRAR